MVRTIAVDLRPPQLDTIGLADAIGSYCSRLETVSRVPIKVTCHGPLEPVPPEVGTACFRIAQEALINVLRHARAPSAEVVLARRGHELELVVRDDGCGFDVAAARSRAVRGSSVGLLGIHERAALAGGAVTVHSVHGSGTTVTARFWLPLERRASKEGA